ncbi:MAG: ABC transporter permease [bacterium]|nr:ABC transporter permease [bacterium]
MKWYRIWAMCLRQMYLYPRSIPRILDILFWPITDLLIWGFLTIFLRQFNASVPNILTLFLGALVFWSLIHRAQQAVSIAFLEEVWEKNLLNIFVTPLKVTEFLASSFFLSLIRVGMVGSSVGFFSFLFFRLNMFEFGFLLIPFVINLFLFGWILGVIATSIILRFGQAAQVLAFALTMMLQPFAAVFYPVSVLPPPLQAIAFILPASHVFEGMREVLLRGSVPTDQILWAFGLNIIWGALGVWLFLHMFAAVKVQGRLQKLVDY